MALGVPAEDPLVAGELRPREDVASDGHVCGDHMGREGGTYSELALEPSSAGLEAYDFWQVTSSLCPCSPHLSMGLMMVRALTFKDSAGSHLRSAGTVLGK